MNDLHEGGHSLGLRIMSLLGNDPGNVDHSETHENTGNHTCDEHLGYGKSGHGSCHDHRHGRRNDRSDTGGSGGNGAGEICIVAVLLHGRDQNAADTYGVRKSRTGDTGKQHGGRHVGDSQTAGDVAHDLVTETDQSLGDTALVHEGTCEHEAGDTQQGERVKSCKESLCKHVKGHVLADKVEQGGNSQAEGDRHTQRQTYNE